MKLRHPHLRARAAAALLAPLLGIATGLATACSSDAGFTLQHSATATPDAAASTTPSDAAASATHTASAALRRCRGRSRSSLR